MRFQYGGFYAYVIEETKDGFYLCDGRGYVMESEQIKELAQGLLRYVKKHDKDIIEHNIHREREEEIELGGGWRNMGKTSKQKPSKAKGYIYLLECKGKYKLGVSKNVERRIKELDKRPFELNLVAKSRLLDEAYYQEQNIHSSLDMFRIGGEWYSLDQYNLDCLKNRIEEL